jgi:hypothetical protein
VAPGVAIYVFIFEIAWRLGRHLITETKISTGWMLGLSAFAAVITYFFERKDLFD